MVGIPIFWSVAGARRAAAGERDDEEGPGSCREPREPESILSPAGTAGHRDAGGRADVWPELLEIPLPDALAGGEAVVLRGFDLAFLGSVVLFHRLLRRDLVRRDLPPAEAGTITFLGLPVFLLASRIAHAALVPGAAGGKGLDYWGGLAGAAIVLLAVVLLRGRAWGPRADAVALAAGAAVVPLRLGSLLDGGYTGLPAGPGFAFAIRFPTPVTEGSFLGVTVPPTEAGRAGALAGEALHPAALYAASGFFVVNLVLRARRPRRGRAGETAFLALGGAALVSGLVAFWRGDLPRDHFGASRAQLEAGGFALVALVGLGWRRLSGPRSSSVPRPSPPRGGPGAPPPRP